MVFMNCRAIFNEIYRAYLGALIKTIGMGIIRTATSNNTQQWQNKRHGDGWVNISGTDCCSPLTEVA